MSSIGSMNLSNAMLVERSYESSAEFMEDVGLYMERRGMFIPLKKPIRSGMRIELAFSLSNGREILSGNALCIKYVEAKGKRPSGAWLKWKKLSDRSKKNIQLIEAWKQENNYKS